jgi:FKBP-type peptidyl-prolyl cis-trans isomerase FklB
MVAVLMGLCTLVSAAQNTPAAGAPNQPAGAPKSPGQPASAFANPIDKRSYAIGMDLGKQFHAQGIEINPDLFAKGIKDATAGGKTLLTEEEARAEITELQAEMRKKMADARRVSGEENKKAGDAFLAQNKTKPGVVTLPSGLQYKVVKAGDGKKPTIDDTVVCNYRGTLINGTEFDSSYKRNQPATFPVKGVIKGWTEALQLMPVGSKWELFIPPDLAYGANGAGNLIGPNATLIFEVELLSIQGQK